MPHTTVETTTSVVLFTKCLQQIFKIFIWWGTLLCCTERGSFVSFFLFSFCCQRRRRSFDCQDISYVGRGPFTSLYFKKVYTQTEFNIFHTFSKTTFKSKILQKWCLLLFQATYYAKTSRGKYLPYLSPLWSQHLIINPWLEQQTNCQLFRSKVF